MTISFLPLGGVDASGTHTRKLRTLGNPGGVVGRATRRLRGAGTAVSGTRASDTPELPAIGTHQRKIRASGDAFYGRFTSGGQLRSFRSFGGDSAGVHRRRYRTIGLPVVESGGYAYVIPQPPVISGFTGVAFEYGVFSAAAVDTLRSTPVLLLAARVLAALSPVVRARMHSDLSAQVRANDRLALWFLQQLADAAVATDTVEDQARYLARLIDSLLATGQVSTYADAVQQLAAAVVGTTEASAFALAALHDTAVAQDVVIDQLRLIARLVDTALAADEASTKQRMTVVLADESTAEGTLDTTLSAFQLLQQGAQAAITLQLDSGVYVAWTYNMQSAGVTRYENYPFNSFAKIGGDYYGLTGAGLYRLGGDTDDGVPIKAKIRLGMTDMGTRKMKRLPEVFMGYTGDGRMVLRVIYVDDKTGEKVGADYLMKPRPAGSKRESRFEPGKGLVAVDYDFELENIDGADFSVTNIEFSPLTVDRRTRG